jgi:hypothetical protein
MTLIGFYAVASDWEVADFCYRNVPKSRIPEHLADATSKAMKLLRYIVTDLAPGEIMVFAPDVITADDGGRDGMQECQSCNMR